MSFVTMKKYSTEDFYFKHEINTRFRDIDAFKHVNNAVFLTYFEDARKTFFERWNINLEEKSLIVASIKIDYHQQLRHPAKLIVGQKLSRLGTTSFDVLSVLFCNNTQISSAITTIVCYDFQQNKSVPLFKEIKQDYSI